MNKKNTDIVLIQPPGWANQNPPLGLALLKSYLATRGMDAKVKDLNIILYNMRHGVYFDAWNASNGYYTWERESYVKMLFDYYSNEIIDFIYSVLSLKPKMIGLSAHCSSFLSARLLATKFKQFSPETKIVFGGPQVAAYTNKWEELLRSGIADAVVFGEGEESLAEYLAAAGSSEGLPIKGVAYKTASGQIVDGGPRGLIPHLDDIPFADFSGFDLKLYAGKRVLPTYFSRGCINRCIYCTENKFFPFFRNRTGRRVFEDVMYQLSVNPDTAYFRMHDSVSNGNIAELEEFCDLLIDNNVKITFNLENAVIRKEMDTRLYKKLKRAGCNLIGYGLENPSKPLLRSIGKTACLDADFDKVVSEGARAKLLIGINMMFGLPGENKNDFEGQLEFIRRHRGSKRHMLVNPALNFCYFPEGCAVNSDPSKYKIDMSMGELYWSSLDGANTFIQRLEKFERFCSLADALGYENLFEVTQSLNKHEMLGNYYYKLGKYEESLRHLKISFEKEAGTSEVAGKLIKLYDKLSCAKDDIYNSACRCVTEHSDPGRSWLDKVCTRRELTEFILKCQNSCEAGRLAKFVGSRLPKIYFSFKGFKNIIKYLIAIFKDRSYKNNFVRSFISLHNKNIESALKEGPR